tara:strand:- start:404 stop:850 length:447 start_codon:yes stop_codon:yes gene_type:complete
MIIVEGGTQKKRDLTTDVALFCARELFPRHRAYTIFIELAKRDEFSQTDVGYCYQGEDDRDIYIDININKLRGNLDELIDTICHEMIHAKQILRQELKDFMRPTYHKKWLCKDGKYREYKNLPYHKLPWEVEAWKRSGKLVKKYKETI